MKTYSIIVTYKDRSHLLKQVIDVLLSIGIHKIIIVDNNSHENTKKYLANLKKKNDSIIKVVELNKNCGSAYAFSLGIKVAIKEKDCEYMWLLDDDNKPDKEAFNELKKYWNSLSEPDKKNKIALASFRENKHIYFKAVQENKPRLVLGKNNIFRSFHMFDIPRSFIRKFSKHNAIPHGCEYRDHGEVAAYPYGGLFFHKNIVKDNGLPDEKYYVYMDDLDFTHRLVQRGGKIILLLNSRIVDIEESWNLKKFAFISIAKERDCSRLYYAIRNRVYFEKMFLVDNYPIYFINLIVYSIIVLSVSMSNLKFKNIHTYCTAVRHGLKGEMGINSNFIIE